MAEAVFPASAEMNRCFPPPAPAVAGVSREREVQAGRTIIVTRNGVSVAQLRPIQPCRPIHTDSTFPSFDLEIPDHSAAQ